MTEAVEHCRRQYRTPVMVHATCIRPYSHSLSDDEKLYKTKAERQGEADRDQIVRYPEWLISEGILDRHGIELITHEVDVEVQYATDRALKAEPPQRSSAMRELYSAEIDPTSDGRSSRSRSLMHGAIHAATMVDRNQPDAALKRCGSNGKMIVFSEDVADASRKRPVCFFEVKPRKGGVFRRSCPRFADRHALGSESGALTLHWPEAGIYRGAQRRDGDPRVKAGAGDPVFRKSYIWPAMIACSAMSWPYHALAVELENLKRPVVVRVAIGGYPNGVARFITSQCGQESIFTHIPQRDCVSSFPSNALDAMRICLRNSPSAANRSGAISGAQADWTRVSRRIARASSGTGLYDPVRPGANGETRRRI